MFDDQHDSQGLCRLKVFCVANQLACVSCCPPKQVFPDLAPILREAEDRQTSDRRGLAYLRNGYVVTTLALALSSLLLTCLAATLRFRQFVLWDQGGRFPPVGVQTGIRAARTRSRTSLTSCPEPEVADLDFERPFICCVGSGVLVAFALAVTFR